MRPGSIKLHAPMVLVLVSGALGMGCSNSTGPFEGADIKVAMVFPRFANFGFVHYEVRTSNGSAIVGPAELDASDPQANAGLDVFVPVTPTGDPGDTVALSATTSDNQTCTGTSAPFQVVAGVASNVQVTLTCSSDTVPGTLGTVEVTTTVAEPTCPSITSGLVTPDETSVGASATVAAIATDPDVGETLTYGWAPALNFADPAAASTTYLCNAAGLQTLSVTVTDSHTPPCAATASFTITCD